MDGDRALSVLVEPDQWARCSHSGTALLDGGGIALAWRDRGAAAGAPQPQHGDAGGAGAGLAFDRWCRAYRSRPEADRVDLLRPWEPLPGPAGPHTPGAGPAPLHTPRGSVVDALDRLHVAEAGACVVRVVDVGTGQVRAVVGTTTPGTPRRCPVDVAAACGAVLVLTHDPVELLALTPAGQIVPGPRLVRPRRCTLAEPVRVAADGEVVLVLWQGRAGAPAVVAEADGTVVARVLGATDLDLGPDGVLAVAGPPHAVVRRFRRAPGGSWPEVQPVDAPAYDGGAVAHAPGGRLAVTTAAGLGWTAGAHVEYPLTGRVVSYRLDATAYRSRWGRLRLAACVPAGTAVRVGFLTSDEDDVPDPLPWRSAERGDRRVPRPEATPPLPSTVRLAALDSTTSLYRRAPADEAAPPATIDEPAWASYEAPVTAAPGRYLWLVLELSGTGRATPTVRALSVERHGHSLLSALPRAWSRDERDADFVQRFLAPAEGLLHDLDERAARRDALLDPARVPAAQLGWLAGLVGVEVDERWSLAARRTLLAEAFALYRLRGTHACIERLLELYLGGPVPVVERWRLRGLAGATLGATVTSLPGGPLPGGPLPGRPPPWVAGGLATGMLGRFSVGGTRPGEDGYTATAHRFTVLLPVAVSGEQRAVVQAIVDHHKPAHTLVDVCDVSAGMRIGRRLHVGLTSVVAPGTGPATTVVGRGDLGTGVVGGTGSASGGGVAAASGPAQAVPRGSAG